MDQIPKAMNSVLLIGMPGMGEWVVIGIMFFIFVPLLILPVVALIDILRNQFKQPNDKPKQVCHLVV